MSLTIERPQGTSATNQSPVTSARRPEPVALLRPVDGRSPKTVYVSLGSVVVREDYHVHVGSHDELSPVRVITWHRDQNSGELTIITAAGTIYLPAVGSRWHPYYDESKMYRVDGYATSEQEDGTVRVLSK